MDARIDEDRERARVLVAQLHARAAAHGGDALLTEAACLLDAYQAGLALATPHPATGCVLRRSIDAAAAGTLRPAPQVAA